MKLSLVVLVGVVVADLLDELNTERRLRGIQQIKSSNTLYDIAAEYFRNQERFKKDTAQAIFGPGVCLVLNDPNCHLGTAEESFRRAGVQIVEIKHEETLSKTLKEFTTTPKGLCMAFSTWFYGCHPWLTGIAVTNHQIHILILSPYDDPIAQAKDQTGLRPVGFNPPSCKLRGMEEYEVPGNNAAFSKAYYSFNAERVLRGLNPIKYSRIDLPSSLPHPCPLAPQDTTCEERQDGRMFYYSKVISLGNKVEKQIVDFLTPLLNNFDLLQSDHKLFLKQSQNSLQVLLSYTYLDYANAYRRH
ncbi:hypothetical protein DSO57_1030617 [Entomophthora muscae]|uniref:Uncharacterized protein n=1 Tax=Entomophthora muscae TaxID=34485 RepID=A0ACC2ULH3_9FUNG|nr:hypothetical protein DSO57_1030617 [Entomophthora muscae]